MPSDSEDDIAIISSDERWNHGKEHVSCDVDNVSGTGTEEVMFYEKRISVREAERRSTGVQVTRDKETLGLEKEPRDRVQDIAEDSDWCDGEEDLRESLRIAKMKIVQLEREREVLANHWFISYLVMNG